MDQRCHARSHHAIRRPEFSTYIYALSFEHAELLIEELRQTARLGGQIQGWVKA